MSDERDELREHLNIEVGKSKKCERGRLEMQYDLMVAVRGLEKAEGELRACSSRNEALDVCVYPAVVPSIMENQPFFFYLRC